MGDARVAADDAIGGRNKRGEAQETHPTRQHARSADATQLGDARGEREFLPVSGHDHRSACFPFGPRDCGEAFRRPAPRLAGRSRMDQTRTAEAGGHGARRWVEVEVGRISRNAALGQ